MSVTTITLQVDGMADPIEVDISLEELTLRESVRLERALGPKVFGRLMDGDEKAMRLPTTLQALVYTKLKTKLPDLDPEGFDLNLAVLADVDPGAAPEQPGEA